MTDSPALGFKIRFGHPFLGFRTFWFFKLWS